MAVASTLAAAQEMKDGIVLPSIATSLPDNGDPSGTRKWLGDRGIVYGLIYTNDVLSNLHGGIRRGTVDQGRLEAILAIDFNKLAGWHGLIFFANAFQIHNTGLMRSDYVDGINAIANIEALPATRLSELWIQQRIHGDKGSVRIGQLAADVEFFYSNLSTLFLQSDWATITAANLPSGGPAYPLATPGVRLQVDPSEDVSLLLAVFNGDPAGPGPGNEQTRNRYGVNFRINDPPFVMAEAQFRANQGKQDTGLARTLKLGGWKHFGLFDDQRFASNGTLLANPAGSSMPARRRGDWGIYGVLEQQIWRPPGGGPDKGISIFGRASASPSDRNLVNFFIDGGVIFAGLVPGRPEDAFGASAIHTRFSNAVRAYDSDLATFGMPGPVRDYETNLELTYQAQIISGWTVQPTLQWIWHPNGVAGRDATVVGLRSVWRY